MGNKLSDHTLMVNIQHSLIAVCSLRGRTNSTVVKAT